MIRPYTLGQVMLGCLLMLLLGMGGCSDEGTDDGDVGGGTIVRVVVQETNNPSTQTQESCQADETTYVWETTRRCDNTDVTLRVCSAEVLCDPLIDALVEAIASCSAEDSDEAGVRVNVPVQCE
ncbi:MAG: hypothetical protein AAFX99_17380 [Myxococcota bacterium]